MLLIIVRQHITLNYATLASVDPLWVWPMSVSGCYEENENVSTNSAGELQCYGVFHINIVKHGKELDSVT